MKKLLLFIFLSCNFLAFSQLPLYGVDVNTDDLNIYDTTTFTSSTIPLTSSTGTIDGCNGLTTDICGTNYVVYRVSGTRYLGTLNVSTGVITEIGSLSDNVSTIAIDAAGVLYGVTGDGATTPETMYTIDKTTAAMTLFLTLGNGDDGECIAFNQDDGLMYHWSGWGTGSVIMETINLSTLTITPITISGATLGNVASAVYADNDTFIISDKNNNGLYYISTTGVVSTTPNTTAEMKGLTFAFGPTGFGLPYITSTDANDTICSGESATLTCLNPGVTYEWFDGATNTGVTTAAYSPTTSGNYVCRITNGTCTEASDTIKFVVLPGPTSTLTPNPNASFCAGDSVEITVNASTGNVTNQWYMDGVAITGATGTSIYATSAGLYNCLKTNDIGCTDSSATGTTVSVSSSPTVNITPSPTSTICDGDSVELSVNAGGGSATFQWYKDGAAINFATNSTYYANSAGAYNCTKTNTSSCTDSSATATVITVNPTPTVTLSPSGSVNFCGGDSVLISVSTGTSNPVFQWYFDGSMIAGATADSYYGNAEGNYNCTVTNTDGCADSAQVSVSLVDSCLSSIVENDITSGFTLFPNPTVNSVYISSNESLVASITKINLIGLDGKVIRQVATDQFESGNIKIDISELNNGIYLIEILTSNNRFMYRVIKE